MKTLYVLGAGASRGHGVKRYPKPPTVREFFHSRFRSKLQDRYEKLLTLLNETLEQSEHSLATVNIEELFSIIEPIWELGVVDKQFKSLFDEMPSADEFVTPLDMLRSWVVDVIHRSTTWLRHYDCPYHQELARRATTKDETIISFNYDLIMDFALQHTREWSIKTGYGWDSHGKVLSFKDHTGYASTPSDAATCLLLKPHGSLNFFRSTRFNEIMKGREGKMFAIGSEPEDDRQYSDYQATDCIEIRHPEEMMVVKKTKRNFGSPPFAGPSLHEIYVRAKDEAKPMLYYMARPGRNLVDSAILPYIVMPTPFKSLTAMSFAELNLIWALISKAIVMADTIVSIGYTFYDQHFNSILAKATSAGKRPKHLVVVSPESTTQASIAKRIESAGLRVKPFSGTFAEFASSTWGV